VTVDGTKYGAQITFNDGLNIIFGPNSVGKTSIVTGIVYGLGAEKSLGIFKSKQNPFKPEFYHTINNKKVDKSYLLLEISNGYETVTIFRYIKGVNTHLAAVKKVKTDDFFHTQDVEKLIISGEGVFSETGFQTFLYKFLNLPEVELPTYDNKLSKLYIENLFPLFFVEQRAGWSQIQARQISRYNIKDIKKVVFEYLFGLDRFKLHVIEITYRETQYNLKKLEESLHRKEENLLIIANAEKIDDIPLVHSPTGKTSIYDYIKYLKAKYLAELDFINKFSSQNKEFEESNEKLREDLKRLDYQYRRLSERIDKITLEISGYEAYLERIKTNKYKNKQLKKIRELSDELNINICPVCEQNLVHAEDNECILCHQDISRNISTPDQNLLFLEDEESTFKKVISQRIFDRRKIIEQRNVVNDKIKTYESQLDHQTSTFAGKEFAELRKRILDADSTYKELQRYQRVIERWENLNPLRTEVTKTSSKLEGLKEQILQYKETEDDIDIIKSIQTFVRDNVQKLGLFKGKKELINQIKVDENDNYTPYLDNYDIYNISSSSDNIRIILSYYLALLQTSLKYEDKHKIIFPKILVLDEPKQQNLDSDSLIDCIEVMEEISKTSSQIILTTYSELKSDKEKLQKHIIYEMESKTDYLLKEIN
jgi:DNA repair exonuclease SbcCD ATPase subunit